MQWSSEKLPIGQEKKKRKKEKQIKIERKE
jgi:hypothetical protein